MSKIKPTYNELNERIIKLEKKILSLENDNNLDINENKELYKNIIDNANDGIYLRNTDGILEYVNDKFLEIHGYSKDEVIGKPSWLFLHPDDLKEISEPDKSFAHIGEGFRGQSRIITKDGTTKHVEMNTVPIKTSHGENKVLGITRDITDRIEAENALKESEEKYRELVNNQGEGIAIIDLNEIFVFANPAAEKIFEVKPGGLVNKSLKKFASEKEFSKYKNETSKRVLGKKSTYETEIITAKGNKKILLTTASPYLDEKGNVKGTFGIFRDNTKLKSIENELRESELRFKTLVDLTNEGIIIHSDGNIIDFNPSVLKLLKITEDVAKTKNVFEYIHPDFHNYVKDKLKSNFTGAYEIKAVNSNGESIPVEVITKNASYKGKKVRVVSLNDLTSRKAIEKEIIRLSTAVMQSPTTIVITDTNGVIEYVNPSFTRITGYTIDEAIGEKTNILKSENTNNENYKNLWKTIKGGKVWEGEFYNKRKDGTYYWESAIIAPIKDKNDEIINFIAIKEDITQRKKDVENLINSEKQLKIANATKDKFFSILAHDLRSPIGNLYQISGLLNEGYDSFDEEKRKNLVHMISSLSEKTFNLLENLLTWSRIQLNKVDLTPEKFELYSVVEETISLYHENLKNKNITCINNISQQHKPKANKESVKVVLRNLISNAIKFTTQGGTIEIKSNQIIANSKALLEIIVKDSGIGIPENQISQLFKIDSNYSTEGTENEPGTGLGLILCKEFVEKNGGTIQVKSIKNKGSEFKFTLPV